MSEGICLLGTAGQREFSEITEVAWSPVVAQIQVAQRSVVAHEEAVA